MPAERSHAKPVAVVLSIAGSDSSGGAGIQADIKTGAAFGVHVATAITAITAQNSQGVQAIYPLTPEQVQAQVRSVVSALPVAAVKVGMLANEALLCAVAEILDTLDVPKIIDPVLGATSGSSLMAGDSVAALYRKWLLPRATLLTPNLPEAAQLLDTELADSYETMEQQALMLQALGAEAVLLKGGHASHLALAVDYLACADSLQPFSSPRQATSHTHGGGCTLATAIAAGMAQGLSLEQSVAAAKTYIQGAICHSERLHLAETNGPIHHFYQQW